MCIAILSTAHPKYALIVIDNRDEFILRPTSRPHWWKPASDAAAVEVLSSRDLQRVEQGTWLGIARDGRLAVLTNYRTDKADAVGERSRGRIVTAWLGAPAGLSVDDFVRRMLAGGETRGVGGFSLIYGRLRRLKKDGGDATLAPLAILCNRTHHPDKVPSICGAAGETHGLSNTSFVDLRGAGPTDSVWPKIRDGEQLMKEAVARAVDEDLSEERLVDLLFGILDDEKRPQEHEMTFDQLSAHAKKSIFIPPLQVEQVGTMMPDHLPADSPAGFPTALYGTQRQTVLLVDWDGQVTYIERALWSDSGECVPRGSGDDIFRFRIEGWESST